MDDTGSDIPVNTANAETWGGVMVGASGPATVTREDPEARTAFRPRDIDREHAPECWDARRLAAVPTGELREKVWLAGRKHAPYFTKIPAAWGLDFIYPRSLEEEGYTQRLGEILRSAPDGQTDGLSLAFVFLDRPLVQLRWPVLGSGPQITGDRSATRARG
jgi:hypothetical protein